MGEGVNSVMQIELPGTSISRIYWIPIDDDGACSKCCTSRATARMQCTHGDGYIYTCSNCGRLFHGRYS